MQRAQRKLDHIKYAVSLGDKGGSKFEDVNFLHNCLTSVRPKDVELGTEICGIKLTSPIFIDAVTGGTPAVTEINRSLAKVAGITDIPMAVGSQYGAVHGGGDFKSYAVVREANPEGIFFANVSALATAEEVAAAVDMIDAAAVEIHLNVAQELLMPEGDKDFAFLLRNLRTLREKITVPVIIKETGCGMAAEQIEQLKNWGFTCFNTGGRGGTSFTAIEAARSGSAEADIFSDWGIPSCWSLIDVVEAVSESDSVIASGGIRSGFDVAKCLALGADCTAISGGVLQMLMGEARFDKGVSAEHIVSEENIYRAVDFIKGIKEEIRKIMVLTSCKEIKDLRRIPLIYTGETVDFMNCRGYSLKNYKRRNNPFRK